MPLASDPDATFEFSLELDKDKPPASRPVFICRFMSSRKRREYVRLRSEMMIALTTPSDDAGRRAFELAVQAIRLVVVDWRNFYWPPGFTDIKGANIGGQQAMFTDDAVTDILTDMEIAELLGSLIEATQLGEKEKKASRCSALSASAASAPNAAAEVAKP